MVFDYDNALKKKEVDVHRALGAAKVKSDMLVKF